VTVQSFEFGGGILLMVIAIDMLGGAVRTKSVDMKQAAIVPPATPLLVGPGTMTTLIVLTGTEHLINILVGGVVAAAAVFLVLRYSDRISTLIGKNGVLATSRLMAIILAAIAANMIHGALVAWGIAKF
jgi:multiple antibiotic resistance protein